MMKNFLYIALALLPLSLNAKNTGVAIPPDSTSTIAEKTAAMYLIEEGKALYTEGKIRDAINKFRDAAKKDVTSWKAPFWISRCHYELYNYGYALKYANDAVLLNNNEVDKEVYEILAESYHRLGKIDSAIYNYEMGIKMLNKNRAAELRMPLRLEQAKFAKTQLEKGIGNQRVHLTGNVNSGYNDYSPVIFNGGKSMYFTSRRSNTTGGKQNPDDQQFFEDIYSAKWNPEINEWDSITNRLGRLNNDGFESVSYISEDGLTALITLNNSAVEDPKVVTKSSDIAEVKWTKQGQWSAPKLLDKTINSSFYDGNGTLTADGQTMYFVSERNANSKMSDIYVSYKQGNAWSKAEALPIEINSKGRETTPFITPDGRYLFFSSNGHPNSMGGYDVYVVERMGSSWGPVKNLGPAINTVNDDFGFKVYNSVKKAYVNGMEVVDEKASLDIYEFDTTLEDIIKALDK
jgi:tetratricopeptide (TPR) repeat protein